MTELVTSTDEVLQAVAERLNVLNEGTLQKEIQSLHLENQEMARQMQERQMLLQLKQLDMQRRNERMQGLSTPIVRGRGDKDLTKKVACLYEVVEDIPEQAIHEEIGRLQGELNLLARHIQERQHVLGLKQMLGQGQGVAGVQVGLPLMQGGVSFQVGAVGSGGPVSGGTHDGPRVDADTKRRAILEIMREQPGRGFKPSEMRTALKQRGMIDPDEGTPVRSLLWKLHKDGHIERPSSGIYSLAGAAAPRETAEPEEASDVAPSGTSD